MVGSVDRTQVGDVQNRTGPDEREGRTQWYLGPSQVYSTSSPYAVPVDRVQLGIVAVLFGFVALTLLFVPLVAVSYRRRGGFSPGRFAAWIALLFYAMGVWVYTLLPLPTGLYDCVGVVLDPTEDLVDVWRLQQEQGGSLLGNAAFQQFTLNVLLFVPLGAFVRLLAGRGVAVAAAAGALASLAVELTQLTGVWGLFPCAYRVFDTGDLVSNTLGAVLGSLVMLAFLRAREHGRPLRAQVQATAPDGADGGGPVQVVTLTGVTWGRRLLAMFVDVLAVWLVGTSISISVNAILFALVGRDSMLAVSPDIATAATLASVGVQAWSVLARGVTIGERAVLVASVETRSPAWAWRLVRLGAGIGGYTLLSMLPAPWSALATALAVASLVGVFATSGHRGLAQWAAGMRPLSTER